ncbi:Crp/Fnr family transcriptional regulator [Novosphingobium humi]|uniref:Helix-turn-helix domain-containing protein n=1 Tax=Novosphingobium humi TaxID=2282397 RepID=A0ABY7U2M3_9SPHN|nr:helix-turn-helix domain-containing protein [Novosphingobium humi]WCT78599.1 helix-turn-helix domain-containing protein [Novosphingobium humi]
MIHSAKLEPQRYGIAMPAKSGEMLFLEGDPCEHVYELRAGVARGISVSVEGDRQVAAFFFAGDQIGLPVTETYRFTAEAVTDLLYVRHSRRCWHEALIRSCREDGRLLSSIWAEQDPIFRRGIILGCNGVLVRLCALLSSIMDRLAVTSDGSLFLPLPQVDMAAYLATTPESVCRALRRLREQMIITMPRRDQIKIIDRERLEAFAGGVARQTGPAFL